jgi:hypothetical protein
MCVAESHSHFGEPVEIGSFGLAIPPEMPHPMVQVVDSDKQDVGPSFLVSVNRRSRGDLRKQGYQCDQN